jgi:DNA-binding transcriptional ArsR family regulator
LIEALGHPLRGRILIVIWERVGVTVKEICRRLDESPRKVRHHVERLMAAGLVELDPKASAGEPRERHYRATVRRILIEDDDDVEEKDRRAAATTVLRTMTEDLRAAIADRTFGTREGHAEVRIPGQVDQEGWERIGTILRMAIVEIEQTMVEGARRLRAAEDPGIEVNTALLLFEAPAWGEEGSRPGDTFGRSLWLGDPPPS